MFTHRNTTTDNITVQSTTASNISSLPLFTFPVTDPSLDTPQAISVPYFDDRRYYELLTVPVLWKYTECGNFSTDLDDLEIEWAHMSGLRHHFTRPYQ